jgi:UDP-glucose 4-epimerase
MKKHTKILITGAGGYIGSNAVYLFLQNGYEVVGIDNFSKGYKLPLELLQKKFNKDKFRYYNYDLTSDLSKLFLEEKNINSVIHYAAFCDINESVIYPQKYISNNISASKNLLKTMIKNDIRKMVFSSTCAVYGKALYIPVDELHPMNPLNPYATSKMKVEKLLEKYGQQNLIKYVILRYFNVTGASDDSLIGDSKKPSSLLVQNLVKASLNIEPFSPTYSRVETPDHSPIRDFINITDLNNAHLHALAYLQGGGKNDVFNIGTGKGYSVEEIIKKIEKITKKKITLTKSQRRKDEVPVMIASIDKAKQVLGWQPGHDLENSINSLLSWYNSNPQGWEY